MAKRPASIDKLANFNTMRVSIDRATHFCRKTELSKIWVHKLDIIIVCSIVIGGRLIYDKMLCQI